MEDLEILNLWKSYDQKLEESLLINRKNVGEITKMKIHFHLSSMKPLKSFTLLVGAVWVAGGLFLIIPLFIFAFAPVSKFFIFSAALQLLLTAIAVIVYVYQLVLINQVNISAPILETQEQLANLKSSTLWVTRILFLQLPLWTTFYLSESMFRSGHVAPYLINGLITLAFTYLSIWLFFNIKYENREKKWFQIIFSGSEWEPVMKSIDLLKQIEDHKITE